MKIAIVLLMAVTCFAQNRTQKQALQPLYDAIRDKESSNGRDKRRGDKGRSRGPYQIQKEYWEDSGTPGRYEDCDKKEYAERVMYNYWYEYAREALRENNYEKLARVHNGGPKGDRKASTVSYWNDIKSRLRRRQVR